MGKVKHGHRKVQGTSIELGARRSEVKVYQK